MIGKEIVTRLYSFGTALDYTNNLHNKKYGVLEGLFKMQFYKLTTERLVDK